MTDAKTIDDFQTLTHFSQMMHKLVITSELTKDEEASLHDVLDVEEEVRNIYDKIKNITFENLPDDERSKVNDTMNEIIKKMKVIVDKHYHIVINNH